MNNDQNRIQRKLKNMQELFNTRTELLFEVLQSFSKIQLTFLLNEINRLDKDSLSEDDKSMVELIGIIRATKLTY